MMISRKKMALPMTAKVRWTNREIVHRIWVIGDVHTFPVHIETTDDALARYVRAPPSERNA